MATIKDVAREAGTSISTVSKALNGYYTISEEKIELVKQVAERLGYRPNARAQTFARKATRSVVLLTGLKKDIAFENPHMFEILAGIESSLREKDYSVTLRHCDIKDVCFLSREIMSGKSADGLMIHASVVTKELSMILCREEIPHIVIGKPDFRSNLCWIDNNNELSGEIAARRLMELGHRKIALIGSLEDDRISEDRIKGVLSELGEPCIAKIIRGDSTIEEGERMGSILLSEPNKITAIICVNNLLAVGCLRALNEKGIVVPDDVSLITFDEYPLAKYTIPPLTTVSIDVYDLGVQAGKLLLRKIKKPELSIQSYSTLPVLVERHTTTRCLLFEQDTV
ncbi:MAG: LacI family transcriptional regulator [Oscillospiraceae bacterium]|nr:LacI family transcriptional regulator [Oscillospiraceae bacterium]MCL2278683.1 LacI family transcriptional regulator [Oscillospiraceae bacterium]